MIREEIDYCEELSCRLLGIDIPTLRKRVAGTPRNGDRYYRGADLLRIGSLIAIEKFNKKMEEQNNER
ncbi:MAG: hypothetical protein E7110_00270 [Bacteroidales bacterium]|nr:hypothetical protein [Bacteroidales bacterium]